MRFVTVVSVTEMGTKLTVSVNIPLAPAKRPVPPVSVSAEPIVPEALTLKNSLSPFAATSVPVPVYVKVAPVKVNIRSTWPVNAPRWEM
jgi:hypothetical protein